VASPALGYAILTAALIVLILGAAFVVASWQRPTHERVADPLRRFAPCVLWITGPTREVICRGGRGFVWLDGRWQPVGQASPVPMVPQR